MKVWKNTMSGGYCAGIILVAANSAEDAHEAFHADSDLSYMWTDWSQDGHPYISDEFYNRDGWKEMPELTANVDKPQVIAECSYRE